MEYQELSPTAAAVGRGTDLGRLQNVPVELAVEIGRTRMTIGEALALAPGAVVTVGRLAGEPVDLLVNGRAIARGEIVAVDEELGLRITEIASPLVGAGEAPEPDREEVSGDEEEVSGAAIEPSPGPGT